MVHMSTSRAAAEASRDLHRFQSPDGTGEVPGYDVLESVTHSSKVVC